VASALSAPLTTRSLVGRAFVVSFGADYANFAFFLIGAIFSCIIPCAAYGIATAISRVADCAVETNRMQHGLTNEIRKPVFDYKRHNASSAHAAYGAITGVDVATSSAAADAGAARSSSARDAEPKRSAAPAPDGKAAAAAHGEHDHVPSSCPEPTGSGGHVCPQLPPSVSSSSGARLAADGHRGRALELT
jgi:hypothetical protein